MKDEFGNVVNVGDKVLFIRDANKSPTLSIGVVEKIYKNDRECTVSGNSHVYNYRLMKLHDNNNLCFKK